jgi:hypothetical protein
LDINKEELPEFDDNGKQSGASYFHPTVAEEFAKELVGVFARDDPTVNEIVKKFSAVKVQIPELKKWLQTRAAGAK